MIIFCYRNDKKTHKRNMNVCIICIIILIGMNTSNTNVDVIMISENVLFVTICLQQILLFFN